jgi:hypothetical protein
VLTSLTVGFFRFTVLTAPLQAPTFFRIIHRKLFFPATVRAKAPRPGIFPRREIGFRRFVRCAVRAGCGRRRTALDGRLRVWLLPGCEGGDIQSNSSPFSCRVRLGRSRAVMSTRHETRVATQLNETSIPPNPLHPACQPSLVVHPPSIQPFRRPKSQCCQRVLPISGWSH